MPSGASRIPAWESLSELGYLGAVDDFSRIGALPLRHSRDDYLRSAGVTAPVAGAES